MRRVLVLSLLPALAAFAALLLYGHSRRHPEDLPWTPLDLGQPVGAFTSAKLAGLEGGHCQALLTRAGVHYAALPDRGAGAQCGYDHAVRLTDGGALAARYRPADLGTQCRVAAALALWEWHFVQPAARRHFGRDVIGIDHFGSYSCRRLYGREAGPWSEHAHANAIDIAGFTLAGGRRISVLQGWRRGGADAAFLHEVRDGACRLFSTVLSPDYNASHENHLHLDQAPRGAWGWRACR